MCVDPESFVDEIPNEMLCPICFHVYCYPNSVMDDDGHEFCSPCIEKWLKRHKRCPLDNTYLDETMLKPLGLMARSLLSNLRVRCKTCNLITTLETLETHESRCKEENKIVDLQFKFEQIKDNRYLSKLWTFSNQLKTENRHLKKTIESYKSNTSNLFIDCMRIKKAKRLDTTSTDTINAFYTRQFITKRIKSIGKKKVEYGLHLKQSYFWNRFAINSNSILTILCYNSNGHGELLIYNKKCEFLKKADINEAKSHYVMGITNDHIYLGYIVDSDTTSSSAGDLNRKIKIDSFDFNLQKKCSHSITVPYLHDLYPIDVQEAEIYVKTSSRTPDNQQWQYKIFVLSSYDLHEINRFYLNASVELLNIKIRNECVIYNFKEDNTYTFNIQSFNRDNDTVLKTFKLDFDSQMSWDMAPNSNLFLLNCNQNTLNEYNLNGKLVKCSKIDVDASGIIISDSFYFAIPNVFIDYVYI